MPAGEQADEQLLDHVHLADDDLRELLVNPSPTAEKLFDRLLFSKEFVEMFRHGASGLSVSPLGLSQWH
jgi:hypothetical protein